MAISINWPTAVINVPKADMTLVQSTPTEIRELNINTFRLTLKDLEDGTEGMPFPKTHNHNTEVSVGGLVLARVVEILPPYTVTFEDGQYAVNLVGANSNIGDKVNVNQVSVRSFNSAGMTSSPLVEYASFNGGITVDPVNGTDSSVFPAGTPQAPVKTCERVMELAEYRGFKKIYFINDFSIDNHSMSGYSVYGLSPRQTTLTIGTNLLWGGGTISDCKVEGTFANNSFVTIEDAEIGNLNNISLTAKNCILSGTVELNNSISSNFYNCTDGVPGSGTPIIQVNDCDSLGIWNYAGGIKLTNMTTVGTTVSFNAPSGRLIVDSTDTQGSIIARGVGSITGTTGGTTVTQTDLINRDTISDSVWDELTAGHTTAGTTGKALSDAGSAGNPWSSPITGNTDAGTFGELVGKKLLTVAKFLGLK